MSEWLITAFLGLVEGVTEFLPISSTGHLILAQDWLHVHRSEFFDVGIQAGAVLAVVLVYWKRLTGLLLDWKKAENKVFLAKCAAAFIVTAVLGLLARKVGFSLEDSNAAAVTAAVVIGAFLIFYAEWHLRHRKVSEAISWPTALLVGLAQVVAGVFPGTSRSAATIIAAMFMGSSRMAATEFSFVLGIPTMFAASGYLIAKDFMKGVYPSTHEMAHFALGFVVATVTAFIAVKWLLNFIRSHTFTPFAWYRLALGAVLITWLLLGGPEA
ncbi:MAG: undecaprenyl-diphosphate phosphatase [bacterium]